MKKAEAQALLDAMAKRCESDHCPSSPDGAKLVRDGDSDYCPECRRVYNEYERENIADARMSGEWPFDKTAIKNIKARRGRKEIKLNAWCDFCDGQG